MCSSSDLPPAPVIAQLTLAQAVQWPGRDCHHPPEGVRCRMPAGGLGDVPADGGVGAGSDRDMSVFIHRIGPKPLLDFLASGGGALAGL